MCRGPLSERARRTLASVAIVAAEDDVPAFEFVTLDTDQAIAAEREGFRVLILESR